MSFIRTTEPCLHVSSGLIKIATTDDKQVVMLLTLNILQCSRHFPVRCYSLDGWVTFQGVKSILELISYLDTQKEMMGLLFSKMYLWLNKI